LGWKVLTGRVQLTWERGELLVCEVGDSHNGVLWDVTSYSRIEVYHLLRIINGFLMSILRHTSEDSILQNFINSLLICRYLDVFSEILIQLFINLIASLTKDHLSIHLSLSILPSVYVYMFLIWLIDILIRFKPRAGRNLRIKMKSLN
jgi:hypothetical protein